MRFIGCAFILVALSPGVSGCKKEPAPAPAPQVKAPPAKGKEEPPPPRKIPQSVLARRMEIPDIRNILKQIGVAYTGYETQFNKAPKRLEDLVPFVEKNQKFIDPLQNGHVTFLYGVSKLQMPDGPSNTILAYETDADSQSLRVVLMADGSVQVLSDDIFKKTPKAGGK